MSRRARSTVNSRSRVRRTLLVGVVGAALAGACTGDGSRELPKGFLSTPWGVAQSKRAGHAVTLAVLEGCITGKGFSRFDHLQVDEGDREIFIAALSKLVMPEEPATCIEPHTIYVTHRLKSPLGRRTFVHAPPSPEWPKQRAPFQDASPDGPPPPRPATVTPYVTPTGPEPTTLPNGEPI